MDVCHQTFSNRYSSYSFSPILTKLGTHVVFANLHKTTDFLNFAFQIFWRIFKFISAAELSRPTGLLVLTSPDYCRQYASCPSVYIS